MANDEDSRRPQTLAESRQHGPSPLIRRRLWKTCILFGEVFFEAVARLACEGRQDARLQDICSRARGVRSTGAPWLQCQLETAIEWLI